MAEGCWNPTMTRLPSPGPATQGQNRGDLHLTCKLFLVSSLTCIFLVSSLVSFPFLLVNWAGWANWNPEGWVGDGHIPWTQNQETVMPVHSGTIAPASQSINHPGLPPPFPQPQAFGCLLLFFFRYWRLNLGSWICQLSTRHSPQSSL